MGAVVSWGRKRRAGCTVTSAQREASVIRLAISRIVVLAGKGKHGGIWGIGGIVVRGIMMSKEVRNGCCIGAELQLV